MNKNSDCLVASDLDGLYVEFLKRFYDEGDRERAEEIAAHFEAALSRSPEFADSIRGEEVRSLIAELHGDLEKAIRSREAEIRKILELHALAVNTPSWKVVAREYDFSDVSDRLDLLAILYDCQGDADRALATLRESRSYCGSHQIAFDGQVLLDELELGRNGARARSNGKKARVRPNKRRSSAFPVSPPKHRA